MAPARSRRRISLSLFRVDAVGLLIVPALLLSVVWYLLPMITVLKYSFTGGDQSAGSPFETLTTYVYLRLFWNTIRISLIVSPITLLLAYPYAYLMYVARPKVSVILGILCLFPYLCSSVVRSFSWVAILAPSGPVPHGLSALGLGQPTLLGNDFAVVVGLTQIAFPFLVLPIFASLTSVRPEYLFAASSLGARPIVAFFRVTLPLTISGVMVGVVLGILNVMGAYVTPQILGSSTGQMLGPSIAYQVTYIGNPAVASAMAIPLMLVTLLLLGLAARIGGLRSVIRV